MTVLEAINKGTEFLARKEIDSARLQSELLLAHILNLARLRLYLDFERQLSEDQSNTFRELLVRRGNHAPLQHIIGSTSFCGFPIKVTSSVLIPRPETEVLAEQAWSFLEQRDSMFADLGTGSGCLPIAIAAHAKNSRGVAIDISPEALALAKRILRATDSPIASNCVKGIF